MKAVEQLYEKRELVTGVPTGFTDLDKKTAGLQPSDLIIVAGRPSMGKTALALNIAQYTALEAKVGFAIISLEMSMKKLVAESAQRFLGILRLGGDSDSDMAASAPVTDTH